MKAHIELPGRWKVSKQNSYLAGRYGRKYLNPAYAAEKERMRLCMMPQLNAQGWITTKNPVAIAINFYGPHKTVDCDNYGLILDVMQGPSRIIGGKRKRGPGLVVWDDSQFRPSLIDPWIKSDEYKITIDLAENGKFEFGLGHGFVIAFNGKTIIDPRKKAEK